MSVALNARWPTDASVCLALVDTPTRMHRHAAAVLFVGALMRAGVVVYVGGVVDWGYDLAPGVTLEHARNVAQAILVGWP